MIKNTGVYQRLSSSTNELERLFKEVDEQKTPIDIKKVLLIIGLGTLSWVSTYSGLLELITANSGDIGFTYKLAIGFAVAMLMLMIVYILDQLFSPLNWLLRTIFIFGYLFLTLISVGFGFGFYWKFLESRSEATRSAESAVGQVQGSLQAGQSRLEQLESTLTTLTALSLQKATEERTKGNSCPNSRPGDGPRRRLRDNDAKSFSFAGDFVTRRAQNVANEIKQLNGDMAKITSRHPSTVDPATGTRNAFMKSLNQRLDLTITRFNSFRTDPQLKSIRNSLADRSAKTQFPDGKGGTFKCPDPQLQSALRGVVQAFDQLPLLEKPQIAAVEGSEATIEAFRRLAATLKGLAVLKMPPSEDEIRKARQKAVRSVSEKKTPPQLTNVRAGLNDRDYIPLAIAIFVDFCLLLVSINRPMDRLKSLVPVMKDARDGPISGILSSFHATHFAGIREEFSLFQHVVFDWGGHYYVAIPLASNDIQAQYLANLFVSLEGRGIVDRAIIPPTFIIRGKLRKMGSSFADHRAFRLYKFRAGAWSNIVLDAVMGAAKDVALENASQRTLEKYNPETEAEENHKSVSSEKSANFASLFDEDTPIIEERAGQAAHPKFLSDQQNQTSLEMPRLLRKVGEKNLNPVQQGTNQQMQTPKSHPPISQNNVIMPATFQQNGQHTPRKQQAFQGAQHHQVRGQVQETGTNGQNHQAPFNPIGIKPKSSDKHSEAHTKGASQDPAKDKSTPPEITNEMKEQFKERESLANTNETNVADNILPLSKNEATHLSSTKIKETDQQPLEKIAPKQERVKVSATQPKDENNENKTSDEDNLKPSEQISKKLEALKETVSSTNETKTEESPKVLQNLKKNEEEPELAHIAVQKITDWYSKDKKNEEIKTEDRGKTDENEI